MVVYVDDVRHRYGRMVMCHMWADTEAELLAMADRIGVARKWLQTSWPHFDISLGKKAEAVAAGAKLTDKYGPVEYEARQRIATGKPDLVAMGEERLASIAKCRSMFGYPADGIIG